MRRNRPVIGVPTQNLQSIGGISPDFPPSWVMSHRYVGALTSVGAVPWLIPLLGEDDATLRAIYDKLDGVFLPGGADVDPASYGEQRHPTCDRSDPPRDAVELKLVKWAREELKPVLGVCRGHQIINLAFGGTLFQDIKELRPESIKHDYFPFRDGFARDHLAHSVKVNKGTRLHSFFGKDDVMVNSMHHQGVDKLGKELVPSAVAPDGVIEGLESANEDWWLVGVQWHPEVLIDKDAPTRKLFAAFVDAAATFAKGQAVSATL